MHDHIHFQHPMNANVGWDRLIIINGFDLYAVIKSVCD